MEDEATLLRDHGHDIKIVQRHNDEISQAGKLSAGVAAMWARSAHQEVAEICRSFKPDIFHCHNTFPLVSPAVYWAAQQAGVPVVQTLHNFRLICANGMLSRNGRPCEDCIGRLPWRGIARACYRDSSLQSAALVSMLALHRTIGSYSRKVTRYIALNNYCKAKFIEGGLPGDRISVKPNFAPDPGAGRSEGRSGILFVGRLTAEKGITTLLDAAMQSQQHVTVAGDGPFSEACRNHPWVDYRGLLPRPEVLSLMISSRALVVPSLWYENMPRTVIEAFACGLPVLASEIGALAEMVDHGNNGILFPPGDASALGALLTNISNDPKAWAARGACARASYSQHYTADANHEHMMRIYAEATADMDAAR